MPVPLHVVQVMDLAASLPSSAAKRAHAQKRDRHHNEQQNSQKLASGIHNEIPPIKKCHEQSILFMTLETLVPVNDSAPQIAAVRRMFSDGPGNPAAGTCGTLRRLPLSPPGFLPVSEGTDDVRASIMLCSARLSIRSCTQNVNQLLQILRYFRVCAKFLAPVFMHPAQKSARRPVSGGGAEAGCVFSAAALVVGDALGLGGAGALGRKGEHDAA